ncbi:MAG: TlpA family protein disulfide reductase [Alphaproteobacteria bacterium]|nr:TlpA family protein disulfide reductase [Alphaproteobacteria bacterium]
MTRVLSVLLCAGLLACDQPVSRADFDQLSNRVAALEAAADAAPMTEAEAAELYETLSAAVAEGRYDEARAMAEADAARASQTQAGRSIARLLSELDVVGRDAPALEVEKWYSGQTDFTQGEATLVVFWEVWCPHCRREVPALQKTWEAWGDKGLNMVALTRVTRSATEDQVSDFIEEQGLTYPVAKMGDDRLSQQFGVEGIPAAAVVSGGKVVWRGHPGRITDAMIERWVNPST